MNSNKGTGHIIFGLINLIILSALFGLIAAGMAGSYNLTPWVAGVGCGGGVLVVGVVLGYVIVTRVAKKAE